MFSKEILKFLLFTFSAIFVQISYAQEIRVIDNKGTLKTAINNSVTSSAIAPTTPLEGDIWYDTSTSPTLIKVYNDGNWVNLSHTGTTGSVFFADTNGSPTENNSQLFYDKANTRLFVGPRSTNDINNELNVGGSTRTSGLNNSNGTAGTPSYRFTSDKNTGMFSPTSSPASAGDLLAFTTGGTEALRIDDTQQVNIYKNLSVVGSYIDSGGDSGIAGQVLSSTATGTKWDAVNTLQDADGDTSINVEKNTDEDIIRFNTNGTERIQINNNGNVSIGNTSPNSEAILDLTNTQKMALLLSTETTPTEIATPTDGMLLYASNNKNAYLRGDDAWKPIAFNSVTNELIFDGDDDGIATNDNYRYVSLVVNNKWKVIRYDKTDVNVEDIATIDNNPGQTTQPLTLADCTALIF
ncbi:hypothetical protein [Polaribacter sp.]|uniref:hypothetical protein n=1 Tax=Polaribacter sp. TaxID=1920175 RepID=UPI003EF47F25